MPQHLQTGSVSVLTYSVVDILTIKYTEVGKMIELLKQSGFKVTIATISGDEMDADQVIVKPDIH